MYEYFFKVDFVPIKINLAGEAKKCIVKTFGVIAIGQSSREGTKNVYKKKRNSYSIYFFYLEYPSPYNCNMLFHRHFNVLHFDRS